MKKGTELSLRIAGLQAENRSRFANHSVGTSEFHFTVSGLLTQQTD